MGWRMRGNHVSWRCKSRQRQSFPSTQTQRNYVPARSAMKAAAVFALRVLALTLVLIIVFMIAINVAGMAQASLPSAQAASPPADQARQAASLLRPLLAYA